jgi:hypothetical protein
MSNASIRLPGPSNQPIDGVLAAQVTTGCGSAATLSPQTQVFDKVELPSPADQQVRCHRSLALDLNQSTGLKPIAVAQTLVRAVGYLNVASHTVRFHTGSQC